MTIPKLALRVFLTLTLLFVSTLARVEIRNAHQLSEADLTDQTSNDELKCTSGFESLTLNEGDTDSPLNGISFQIHRNGDIEPCGSAPMNALHILEAFGRFEKCPEKMDKMDFESFLTSLFSMTLPSLACSTLDKDNAPPGILDYCDMGEDKTPILLDHKKLVKVPEGSLPCRFYTREGVRINSLTHLADIARDKKESLLSLSVKVFGEPKYVKTIGKGNFTPAPKIDSAIIAISGISNKLSLMILKLPGRYFIHLVCPPPLQWITPLMSLK